MNKSNTNTPTGPQARTNFIFDPAKVTINNLYITQVFGSGGYTTARIFSNEVMHARLLLKYSYEVDLDDFTNGETDAIIMAIVKAEVEDHFKNDDNLIICQAFYPETDVTETGWKKVFDPNGYLIDLDNDGRHIDFSEEYLSGYIDAMSKTSGKSQLLYNPAEALAEPRGEIVTDQDTTPVNLVFSMYVTPPAGSKTNYTLWARYTTQDSSQVSLQTEPFNVTEDTLQLSCIAKNFYTGENEDFKSFSVLYALCYRGDKYGAAKPYNITTYRGLVLKIDDHDNKTLCLSRVNDHYIVGIFYYPEEQNPYMLYAAREDQTCNIFPVKDITENELTSVNPGLPLPDLAEIIPKAKNADSWQNTVGFDMTERQTKKAHRNGIPVLVRRTLDEEELYLTDKNGVPFEFQIERPYGIEDNCGNTFDLSIKWPDRSVLDITDDYGYDYNPNDIETDDIDFDADEHYSPRTRLYAPDIENMYKLKVWPYTPADS